MKIHLWDAYNPMKISVDLNKELKNKIAREINQNTYEIADKLNVTPARLYDYFIYQNASIPLNVLINLSKLLQIHLIKIEQNIIMYKQMFVPNKNSVKNPKLPLNISPYLTSIVSHLYFDGSVPEDGKGTYYNQKNEEIMDDFINKIISVFGDVKYSLKKDHRGVLKCRLPRIIGEICKSIYQVESFGTFDSRVSMKIFKLSKEHKRAFILTAILDEGSITYDGTIMFGIMNKKMCEDVRILCNNIGLTTNSLRNKKNSDFYYFHIKSIEKFYKIIKKISIKYPFLSLRYKEERLRSALEIKKKKFYNTKIFADKRKDLILGELKKNDCSINYLSQKYLIPPRSIRRYMYQLIKKSKVSRKKISNEYYYFLTNPH